MDGYQPRRKRLTSLLSFGSIAFLLLILIAGLLTPGCREDTSLPIDRNHPPETILTGAPGDSQTSFYRVHLYWNGSDPDGEVVGYEWAITESLPDPETIVYRLTARTDSVFNLQVEPNREVLAHRFYVRAVDNEGKRDETPAYTFFAARNNCEPKVTFTEAVGIGPDDRLYPISSINQRVPGDTVPAGSAVRFRWNGHDCDVALDPDGTIDSVGHVTRFSHHLTPLEINDIEGTLADTTASYDAARLKSGAYVMYVRAVDDAGFAGLDPEVRTFVWNYDPKTSWTKVPSAGGDSVRGFWADTSDAEEEQWVPIAEGDTLPAKLGGVKIRNHIVASDPDSPNGDGRVESFEARLVVDSSFWQRLTGEPEFQADRLFTLDGVLMCRARDQHGRYDGTPDSLRIVVNKAIRFVTRGELPDQGGPFVQRPLEGERVSRRLPPNSPGDSLVIKFFGSDPDPVVAPAVEMRYRFASYPGPNGTTLSDSFFSPWAAQGVYWAVGAQFERPQRMLPGEYTLEIEARELRSDATIDVGSRKSRKTVHFTLLN